MALPDEHLAMATPPSWRIGGFRFERSLATCPHAEGRWGCCWDDMIGVSGHRTPLGALLAVRGGMHGNGDTGT